ncbi:MAG: GNAT family N-acetyltransferase [Sulfitobacter sp.]|nr:GNAT family N-acetyltransferase [Sulfitobacter sp.]
MTLRQLTHQDAPALRALWSEGLRQMPAAFLLTEAELLAIPEERFAANIDGALHLGTFADGRLLGFVIARRGGVARLRHTADIGPLYVSMTAQGRGLGRALMQAALDTLTGQGLKQVELTVDETNTAAVGLYKDLGFTAFGRRPRSVIVNGIDRTDILMIRALDGAELFAGA